MCLLSLPCAAQDEYTGIIKTALKTLDYHNFDEQWQFNMTVETNDGQEIIRQVISSNPERDKYERRQLDSVNGEAPDRDQLADFRQAERKRIDEENPDTKGYAYLVDSSSLALLQQHDGDAEFSFQPRVQALEDSRDQLQGSLTLNTDSQQIDRIEITNTEPLKPAFSVTLEYFRLTFFFHLENGQRLLHKMTTHTVGKAGFFKRFDSTTKVNFGDYKQVIYNIAIE